MKFILKFILPVLLMADAGALTFPAASFDTVNSPTRPLADPSGAKLAALADAAGAYWASIIQDTHSVTSLVVRYDVAAPDGGALDLLGVTGGRVTSMRIRVRPSAFFFDATPESDSEYAMTAKLDGALVRGENYPFTGTPPEVLEVNWSGAGSGGAAFAVDLFTVLLHQFGYALGFSSTFSAMNTEAADGDIDFFPGTVGGNTVAVLVDTVGNGEYYLPVTGALMHPNTVTTGGKRTRPSALDILAVTKVGGWANVTFPRSDWMTGDGNFSTASAWIGAKRPTGSTDAAIRRAVSTTVASTDTRSIRNLLVGGNSKLRVDANTLNVVNVASVEYQGGLTAFPTIEVGAGAIFSAPTLDVLGGTLRMNGGSVSASNGVFLASSLATGRRGKLQGFGQVVTPSLLNSGEIVATGDGILTVLQPAPGAIYDLDGSTASADVRMEANQGSLAFVVDAIADAYDGSLSVSDQNFANFVPSWTLGAGGRIILDDGELRGDGILALDGSLTADGASVLDGRTQFRSGSVVTIDGFLSVFDDLEIHAGSTVNGTGQIIVSDDVWVENGAGVSVNFTNRATCHLGLPTTSDDRVGQATFGTFGQNINGVLNLTITDLTQIPNYDRINCNQATVEGTIVVNMEQISTPIDGMSWTVINATSALVITAGIEYVGVPAGFTADLEKIGNTALVTLRQESQTYAAWMAAQEVPLGESALDADYDQDGVSNGIEAYFQTDPTSPTLLPVTEPGTVIIGNDTYGEISAILPLVSPLTDLILEVQHSEDLIGWSKLGLNLRLSEPLPNGRHRATYNLTTPIVPSVPHFFRLSVRQSSKILED